MIAAEPLAARARIDHVIDPADALRELIRELVREEVAAALAGQPHPDENLRISEAAEIAKVVPGSIRRWIRLKHLPTLSAGRELRVRRSDLERLMSGARPGREPDEDDVAEAILRKRR